MDFIDLLEKQALSPQLVTRALAKAFQRGTPRGQKFLNKTERWLPGAESRAYNAVQRTNIPLPSVPPAFHQAVNKRLGSWMPLQPSFSSRIGVPQAQLGGHTVRPGANFADVGGQFYVPHAGGNLRSYLSGMARGGRRASGNEDKILYNLRSTLERGTATNNNLARRQIAQRAAEYEALAAQHGIKVQPGQLSKNLAAFKDLKGLRQLRSNIDNVTHMPIGFDRVRLKLNLGSSRVSNRPEVLNTVANTPGRAKQPWTVLAKAPG